MDIIITSLTKLASGIGPFFLLLGLLIFVHELGHFLVAIYFGVRVETFSLGFGKKIFSKKRGDTTYCLSIIPLGGYVKMYGDDPSAEVPEDQKKYSFLHKPVWPRIAIVVAGPLMNLFFAIFVFAIVGFIGENFPSSQLGDIENTTAAYKIGFRSGDSIQKINDQTVTLWSDVKSIIEDNANKNLTITIKREDGSSVDTLKAEPELVKNSFIFTTQREVGQIEGLVNTSIAAIIGIADPKSLAAQVGLKTFDVIDKINGEEIMYWRSLEQLLQNGMNDKEIKLSVHAYTEDPKGPVSREIFIPTQKLNSKKSIVTQLGISRSDLFLWNIRDKSPAKKSGLTSGDLVTKVDGVNVTSWQSVLDRVKSFKSSEKIIAFTVLRNGEEQTLNITPELVELPTEQGAMEKRFAIGVMPAIISVSNTLVEQHIHNPIKALIYGISQSWTGTKLIAISFVRLIQNEVSARNIGGVITIGRVASKSFEAGIVSFLKMMAIISINLFLLNLLPIPVLDGGHLLFFSLEALRGAPISFKKLEIAQQVGLALLLALMIFALFNDISQLISSW
ncbi:MAG: RIP metalloprotease RseP [Bdellovibrionales bacterium]